MLLKNFSFILLASLLIGGCIPLDITPTKLDIDAMKAYARPTKPTAQNPNRDLDLTKPDELHKLHKMTCFSADDLAEIERVLNK